MTEEHVGSEEGSSHQWLELLAIVGSDGNESSANLAGIEMAREDNDHPESEESSKENVETMVPSKPYEEYEPIFETIFDEPQEDQQSSADVISLDSSLFSMPVPSLSMTTTLATKILSHIPQATIQNSDRGILNDVLLDDDADHEKFADDKSPSSVQCDKTASPSKQAQVPAIVAPRMPPAKDALFSVIEAISKISKTAGEAITKHPYVTYVQDVASESAIFAVDRAKLLCELYLLRLVGDDPQSQHCEKLAETKVQPTGEQLFLKSHLSSISWLDRQLTKETRDDCFSIEVDEELDTVNIVLNRQHGGERGAVGEMNQTLRAALHGDETALHLLHAMLKPPTFKGNTECYFCSSKFSVRLFRHHCRHCGQSCCSAHSTSYRKILKFGYINPVRVCDPCCIEIDESDRNDRLKWRNLRIQSHLEGSLIPYFEPMVDRHVDKALRVAEGALYVVKNTLILNYPAAIVVNAIDVVKRYGMSGLAGVLMRKDFVDAVETLKRISGMDKAYPISLQELTACIYYKLAIDRGLRGCKPDHELQTHTQYTPEECARIVSRHGGGINQCVFEREKRGFVPLIEKQFNDSWGSSDENAEAGDSTKFSSTGCSRASDDDIEEALLYAPVALEFVYSSSCVDAQRLAMSQGWETIFFKETAEPEQPAFALFASFPRKVSTPSAPSQGEKCLSTELFSRHQFTSSSKYRAGLDTSGSEASKVAVLAIRGTSSVHDVVTDIRAAPTEFPPKPDEIKTCLFGKEEVEKSSLEALQVLVDAFVKAHAYNGNSSPVAEFEREWEWLNSPSDMSYASGGIARAAMWTLKETGPSIVRFIQEGYSIRVVGHSLGGAVAALVVHMVKEAIEKRQIELPPGRILQHCDIRGIVYGVPSFVDAATADSLHSSVLNVILHDDIIPRITPQSIRALMKELMVFREKVFKYIKQDWTDVIARASSIWRPRTRHEGSVHNIDNPKETSASSSADIDAKSSEALPAPLNMIFPQSTDDENDPSVLVDEDELVPLWQPGKIIHIYSYSGVYLASEVKRTFPEIRRIEIQGNIFTDHSSEKIFEALKEVKSVRRAEASPPQWVPYDASICCQVCNANFTWHSTFRGEAEEYRERYNCRSCGRLVCGPCSQERRRQPVPRIGLLNKSRLCDKCFFSGDNA